MASVSRRHSPPAAVAAGLLLACTLGPPAAAQTVPEGCAATVPVTAGDTLGSIARRCGTTVEDLLEANPGTDPHRLGIGQMLNLPAAAQAVPAASTGLESSVDGDDTARRQGVEYTVRAGDTLDDIAGRFGTTTEALIVANPALRGIPSPRPGMELFVPGLQDELPPVDETSAVDLGPPQVQVSGLPAPGDQILVIGHNFVPGATATISAGPVGGPAATTRDLTAAPDGSLRATLTIPRDVAIDRRWQVEITSADGTRIARSDPMTLRAADTGDAPALRLSGTLGDGAECPVLRTDDGGVYALAGGDEALRAEGLGAGDRVTLTGRRVDAGVCMQGTPIAVRSIRRSSQEAAR